MQTDTPESLRALAERLQPAPDVFEMPRPLLVEIHAALRRAADRLEAENRDGAPIASHAYQVIGVLTIDLPDTPEIVRALDYFSEGKFDEGFLPWRRDWLDENGDANKAVQAAVGERVNAYNLRCVAERMEADARVLRASADRIEAMPDPGVLSGHIVGGADMTSLAAAALAAARREGAEEMRERAAKLLDAAAYDWWTKLGDYSHSEVKKIAAYIRALTLPGDER